MGDVWCDAVLLVCVALFCVCFDSHGLKMCLCVACVSLCDVVCDVLGVIVAVVYCVCVFVLRSTMRWFVCFVRRVFASFV